MNDQLVRVVLGTCCLVWQIFRTSCGKLIFILSTLRNPNRHHSANCARTRSSQEKLKQTDRESNQLPEIDYLVGKHQDATSRRDKTNATAVGTRRLHQDRNLQDHQYKQNIGQYFSRGFLPTPSSILHRLPNPTTRRSHTRNVSQIKIVRVV